MGTQYCYLTPAAMPSMKSHKTERSTCTILGIVFVAFWFSALFFGSWPEFTGIQESFRAAGLFYHVATAAFVLGMASVAAALFILFRHRMQKGFTRFLYVLAFLAGGFAIFHLVAYLNVKLDSTPGEPMELELIDLFAIEAQRRDRKEPFTQYYAGFSVPEGLSNYSLLLLHEDQVQSYTAGQKFLVEAHPGFFALPWYKFRDRIGGTKNQDIDSIGALFRILSAKGVFSQGSSHRERLEDLGVPVLDLRQLDRRGKPRGHSRWAKAQAAFAADPHSCSGDKTVPEFFSRLKKEGSEYDA